MWITMTSFSERQRELFLYTEKQNNCDTFIYSKNLSLFKKLDHFR